jgi:hypothetical protein
MTPHRNQRKLLLADTQWIAQQYQEAFLLSGDEWWVKSWQDVQLIGRQFDHIVFLRPHYQEPTAARVNALEQFIRSLPTRLSMHGICKII